MEVSLLQAASDSVTWPEATVAVGGIALVTAIVVVAIWQVFASWRARMSVAREDAYRKLAEDSAGSQHRMVEQQEAMATDIASLKSKVDGIEKLLREVG